MNKDVFGGFDFADFFKDETKEEKVLSPVVEEKQAAFTEGFGFEDWSKDLDSFFQTSEKPKKEEKKNKGAVAKKDEKKKRKSGGQQEDMQVSLPVVVKGRGFEDTLDGEGTITLKEVRERLLQKGYEQFKIPGMGLYYVGLQARIYVVDGSVQPSDHDLSVNLSEEKTVTVIDGLLSASFSAADFTDKDEEDIMVQDVAERFALINPYYEGCRICYDEKSGLCYPIFSEMEYGAIGDHAKVYFGGVYKEMDEEGISSVAKIREYFLENAPQDITLQITKTKKEHSYMVRLLSQNAYQGVEADGGAKKDAAKKVEEKYKLPLELYIVTFNCFYPLKPEYFDGKEKVTLEEIKDYMKDKQRMFSDKTRKLDVLYNEDMNRLAVMFVSGSKGCEMIRDKEAFQECMKKEQFYGFYTDTKITLHLLALPHGNFVTKYGNGRECVEAKQLYFFRKLPLIPKEIFLQILEFFREDLSKEAMVRIYYHKEEQRYFIKKAEGKRTKVSIQYEFSAEEDMFSPKVLQVMEIHSHNTMPAFFSAIDDRDEKDYPGIFGVVGNLDMECPSVKLRAGHGGLFQELPFNSLFEV